MHKAREDKDREKEGDRARRKLKRTSKRENKSEHTLTETRANALLVQWTRDTQY